MERRAAECRPNENNYTPEAPSPRAHYSAGAQWEPDEIDISHSGRRCRRHHHNLLEVGLYFIFFLKVRQQQAEDEDREERRSCRDVDITAREEEMIGEIF